MMDLKDTIRPHGQSSLPEFVVPPVMLARLRGGFLLSFHWNPSLGPVTFEYGFAQQQFFVTVLESCEDSWARKITRGKILINRSIKLLERVWKTFVMTAGIAGERADILSEQRRISNQEFIWLISVAEPEIIRVL
jgi:hypothetical protein